MSKLDYVKDRVICRVWMDEKNWHTMPDGSKIRLERKYDNFNNCYTQPINATVEAAENIAEGTNILIHHNSCHDTNRIFNYQQVSGEDIASDIRYFSVSINECFAWYNGKEWMPLPGYDFALRIFKPYNGILLGVEPTLIKNVLWVTTGEYKNKAVITLKNSDYQIIFQDKNGREGNLIRFRSSENIKEQREAEVVAIHDEYTDKILNGELIIGLSKSEAKPLKETQYA